MRNRFLSLGIRAGQAPGTWPVIAGERLGTLTITDDDANYGPLRSGPLPVTIRRKETR